MVKGSQVPERLIPDMTKIKKTHKAKHIIT